MVRTETKQHLGWVQIAADEVADVGEAIVDEKAWGAVVVNAGASASLAAARASGNSSYSPASAITFYYAQARNEQATGSYVNPLTTAALTQILQQFNARSAATYLSSISGNATTLQAFCPFSNNVQAVRTILFNHMGRSAGIILAWVFLSCITIPLFTIIMRRRDVQEHQKEMEEKNGGKKGTA